MDRLKDLKYLIWFEDLLENADNELVQKAQADGKLAIGYTCYHMQLFPRLRARDALKRIKFGR